MKILYVTSDANWGGSSVALYNLISGITDKNDIYVLMPHDRGELSFKLKEIGVKCFYTKFYNSTYPSYNTVNDICKFLYRLIKILWYQHKAREKVSKLIELIKPDIVHCNVGPLDITLDACLKYKIPHIWHLREYQKLDLCMNIFPSRRAFFKKIHTEGNFNIAITKGIFNYFKLRDCDVQIYDGVYSENKYPVNYKWPVKQKYFLYVGSIIEGKNLLFAIEAFKDFVKDHKEFKLLIAGNQNTHPMYTRKCMKYISENKLSQFVVFLGQRSDVYELMQQATSLIVPSNFEAFGFITAEAMFNKCLVLGRNTAGTKEQFDNIELLLKSKYVFRFSSKQELVAKLKEAVLYNDMNTLTKIRDVVSKEYSIENHIFRIMDFYKKVINNFN